MSTYSVDYIASKVYSKLPPITPKENGIIYSSDDCLQSSYNEEYSSKKRGSQLPSFKPLNNYEKVTDIFPQQSSYKEDFIPHKSSKQKSLKPILNYSLPTESFTTDTNYTSEFTGKKTDRVKGQRPIDSYQQSRSYDGSLISNHGTHSDGINESSSLKSCSNDVGNGDWTSNYHSEFTRPSRSKIAAAGFSDKLNKTSDIFSTETSNCQDIASSYFTDYNDNFIKPPHQTEKVSNFKPQSEYKPPDQLVDSMSSYASDFVKVSSKPSKSFKPVTVYRPPEEALSSRSLYNEEFSSTTKSPRVQPFLPNNQIQFESKEMEFITNYGDEFSKNPQRMIGEKPHEFRPTNNLKLSNDAFSATSTYGHEFIKRGSTEKVEPVEKKNEIFRFDDKMEFMSTSKADFNKKKRQVYGAKGHGEVNVLKLDHPT